MAKKETKDSAIFEYEEKGQVVNTILTYSIGFGLVIVIIIFMTVLAAKIYESQQSDIAGLVTYDVNGNVTSGSAAIAGDVNSSIEGGFEAMQVYASNLDIVSIAVIFGVALVVILASFGFVGLGGMTGRGSGGFSAI